MKLDSDSESYLKERLNDKHELIDSLNHEIEYYQRSINSIRSSKAFKLWSIFCKIKGWFAYILEGIQRSQSLFVLVKSLNSKLKSIFLEKRFFKKVGGKGSGYFNLSVIIPTFNAADYLPTLLEAIRAQKNIDNLDVVIIDSQSSDRTCQIAESYDANVIHIDQKDFQHGNTRNIAAKHAKHSHLLFTVQDALPADRDTYWKMSTLLEREPTLAAVTTRQIPRPDADLFARWQIENHNSFLKLNENRISRVDCINSFENQSFILKRKISILDNVCTLYRKSVFNTLGGFSDISFGEDLDFAVRALKAGFSLGLRGDTGVIHSHNRTAIYFFQRAFVSSLVDLNLLDNVSRRKVYSPSKDISLTIWLLEILNSNYFLSDKNYSRFDLHFDQPWNADFLPKSKLGRYLFDIKTTLHLKQSELNMSEAKMMFKIISNLVEESSSQNLCSSPTVGEKKAFFEKILLSRLGNKLARHCLGKQTQRVKSNHQILLNILNRV